MRRKSQAGRAEAVKKEWEPRREVWLTRSQLDRMAAAITPRYRALVLAAALTGLRWGELAARTIALDHEAVDAFLGHRRLVGDSDYVFTTPGGSQGPGGPLARSNFWRVWNRAVTDAKLHTLWPEHGGLHFHDLRHTHATWLLARRVPLIAVANRLGHANPVITMMV